MSPKTKKLILGSTGRSVGELHRILIELGYSISDGEKTQEKFGDSTKNAVTEFQRRNKFKVASGEVDIETANMLKAARSNPNLLADN